MGGREKEKEKGLREDEEVEREVDAFREMVRRMAREARGGGEGLLDAVAAEARRGFGGVEREGQEGEGESREILLTLVSACPVVVMPMRPWSPCSRTLPRHAPSSSSGWPARCRMAESPNPRTHHRALRHRRRIRGETRRRAKGPRRGCGGRGGGCRRGC